MNVTDTNWHSEFGLDLIDPRAFIANKAALATTSLKPTQSHVLRRAFDLFGLDGVLCTESAPLVYFKQVPRLDPQEIHLLHRTFWNHGGAPILVLLSPSEIHVYSALVQPTTQLGDERIPALVDVLQRATVAVREFLPAVESGEFFRTHPKSFNPEQRVDRRLLDNLEATRRRLVALQEVDDSIVDALLCRLVFACYLFDRNIIGEDYLRSLGLSGVEHLRELLELEPERAKRMLYKLFNRLGRDFNGDLFSDDLDDEADSVPEAFLPPLAMFFRGTEVASGQRSFWPYDFGVIPVETISAIYERFLRDSAKDEGAFYTPRFLAEVVLDLALSKTPDLLNRRYLDPACGSGIFLVGLFNRLAEEWKQSNPTARNDRRARELQRVLCSSICGVDINPTACRITAFSLYLAYLDQLSPRDIVELKEKGHKLPALVHFPGKQHRRPVEGSIWCADFFSEDVKLPNAVDIIVGNPPWGSSAATNTLAGRWCASRAGTEPVPDRQIALAFAWKAGLHAVENGRLCFVLPHGTIFNHSKQATAFQREFFKQYSVDHVLNLADYQRFLFDEARHPAIVIAYRKQQPPNSKHTIQYWAPKVDWLASRAEIITVTPEDRSTLTLGDLLADLKGADAPQIWKQRYWATGRDWRLLDRLAHYPRLRDHVGRSKAGSPQKRWLIAEGFQPLGPNDDIRKAKKAQLPSRNFIKASAAEIDLFVLKSDAIQLPDKHVELRRTSNSKVFRAPHVLVAKGFKRAAFADFDVTFRHAVRGISGPKEDREMLMFLAGYLRTSLASYFAFHTSSNWGVSRAEVQVDELLRLPFPLPEATSAPERAAAIVKDVAVHIGRAMNEADAPLVDRDGLVRQAMNAVEPLIHEYFDILPSENALISDTVRVTIPSVRPARDVVNVPTLTPSGEEQRSQYTFVLCETLNSWSQSDFKVTGTTIASSKLGVGVTVLCKQRRDSPEIPPYEENVLESLEMLQRESIARLNTMEFVRGVKVFVDERLFIVKPIAQRFWTHTAALNDADEVAATLLMRSDGEEMW